MAYRQGGRIVAFGPSFIPFVVLYQLCLTLVRILGWLFFGLRVRGRENLRDLEDAVLVSNHTLLVDPGIIAHVIRPRRTYFFMLEETALIPWLGTFVRLLGGTPIPSRSFVRLEKAVATGIGTLGYVHFFPEGECYRWNQKVRPFSPGAFFLACRLGIPVVPITTVLHERSLFKMGLFEKLPRRLRVPRVTMVVGRPFDSGDYLSGDQAVDAGPDTDRPRSAGIATLRSTAESMAEAVRKEMQSTIDRAGGSKTIYRGAMPRLVKQNTQSPGP